uniref:Lysozyme n=1 Tax=Anisakis simplex TaxID=6269 RepID=A0A0M3JPT1_ANISI
LKGREQFARKPNCNGVRNGKDSRRNDECWKRENWRNVEH